jgi:hypothetical protein
VGCCCPCPLRQADNEPLLGTALHVSDEIAVSYGKAVEHRKALEFQKQEDKARGV